MATSGRDEFSSRYEDDVSVNQGMNYSARESYLAQRVLTASQPRLHLMLIEAALGHLQRAEELAAAGEQGQSGELILKSQTLVAELMAGLLAGGTQVGKELAAVYSFIHRKLVEASLARDRQAVAEAARVLGYERETWSLVCDRLHNDPAASQVPAPHSPKHHFASGNHTDAATFSERGRSWQA
jgi:flagellar protein FliS